MEVILNVDDYGPGRYARTKVLRQAGFLVHEAGTGEEALRIVAEHKPVLVLLDVNLPDVSGFEVCRQIRADVKSRATTIVHISASNVQIHHQVTGLESGADGYLVEPIDSKVLIATIRAFLRARKAEDALRKSVEELEWFGHRVAHDLREPLRTMAAHTELLELELGPDLTPRSRASLHFVIDAATRMQTFVDGLLRYAQSADVGTHITKCNCEEILAQVLQTLEASIKESTATVSHDALPEILADPNIESVFQNLISNAIKYRRPAVPPQIHISARLDGDDWVFSVQDNGMGIDPKNKEGIFKIFHRLHGREVPGSGIGLALSKKIVEAHTGSIWVESDSVSGSTFFFRLPVSRESAPRWQLDSLSRCAEDRQPGS